MNTFVLDQLQFLGLREREVKVFTALATFGRMHTSKLAVRSKLPRTTVIDIVRRLVEQGLVKKETVGKHEEFSVALEEVADRLDVLEKKLRGPTPDDAGCAPSPCRERAGVRVRSREKEDIQTRPHPTPLLLEEREGMPLLREYASQDKPINIVSEFQARKGDRAKVLMGGKAGQEKESVVRLIMYIAYAVGAGLRVEILLSLPMAKKLRVYAEDLVYPKDPNDVRLNVVPALYSDAPTDMVLFRDMVLIRSIHTGEYTREDTKQTVETMKHLVTIASETGWSVNMGAWMEEK